MRLDNVEEKIVLAAKLLLKWTQKTEELGENQIFRSERIFLLLGSVHLLQMTAEIL
jgi:hypothetical protein